MNIIIVGAGRIGRNLAKCLADEKNEVYLIENKELRIQKFADKLDVKIVQGNGADPDILKRAQVESADLVLAVTTTDETNLVVCSLATILGAKRCIARVRNMSLNKLIETHGTKQFQVDAVINPEVMAAESIVKAVLSPGASEVSDFANGKLMLRGFDVPEGSPLCSQPLGILKDEDFPWPFLIVAIIRNEKVIFPKGDSVIEVDDHIYGMLPSESLAEFLTFVDPHAKMPKKIIVYGATMTGIHVAKALVKKRREVILLEEDPILAEEVAGELESVRVVNGSPSEAEILNECGVEVADVFVAVSNSDNSNLISSVLAKKMGARSTIIMTQQADFMRLNDALNIDAIINPQTLAIEKTLHLVRGGGVSSVIKLMDYDAEILEFEVQEHSSAVGKRLKEISFPKNSIIGAVYKGDDIHLAQGDTEVHAKDKVVAFSSEKAGKKLQDIFTKK